MTDLRAENAMLKERVQELEDALKTLIWHKDSIGRHAANDRIALVRMAWEKAREVLQGGSNDAEAD